MLCNSGGFIIPRQLSFDDNKMAIHIIRLVFGEEISQNFIGIASCNSTLDQKFFDCHLVEDNGNDPSIVISTLHSNGIILSRWIDGYDLNPFLIPKPFGSRPTMRIINGIRTLIRALSLASLRSEMCHF